jgi:hypothetical protein
VTDTASIIAAFKGGPLDSCSLPNIPNTARILYITFNVMNRDNIRWAAWTTDQPLGTVPSLVVDPGESVYVYKIAQRPNPVVQIKDNNYLKHAVLFEFWSEGTSVRDTLCEDHGGTKKED